MDDIARYGAYLTNERHASQNTVSSYLRDVNQFNDYLRAEQGCAIHKAKPETVKAYMKWMQARGKSPSSVTRFLASIKSFYNYLLSVGAVKINPAKGLTGSALSHVRTAVPGLPGQATPTV